MALHAIIVVLFGQWLRRFVFFVALGAAHAIRQPAAAMEHAFLQSWVGNVRRGILMAFDTSLIVNLFG
jgi:hypothetical protein